MSTLERLDFNLSACPRVALLVWQ